VLTDLKELVLAHLPLEALTALALMVLEELHLVRPVHPLLEELALTAHLVTELQVLDHLLELLALVMQEEHLLLVSELVVPVSLMELMLGLVVLLVFVRCCPYLYLLSHIKFIVSRGSFGGYTLKTRAEYKLRKRYLFLVNSSWLFT
jgi:hypothetical protein